MIVEHPKKRPSEEEEEEVVHYLKPLRPKSFKKNNLAKKEQIFIFIF